MGGARRRVGRSSGRLAKDRKPREVFCVGWAREVEGQQSLVVAYISLYRKRVVVRSYDRHGSDLMIAVDLDTRKDRHIANH